MKKVLMKEIRLKFRVRSLVVMILIGVLMITAVAAAPSLIQATLSPDITVKYNGAEQTMKDISGTVVYPISYNGTTYVPLRAVGTMLGIGVEWESSTRTVLLGNTSGEARLVDVCEKRTDVSSMVRYADKMSSIIELPGGDSTRVFNSAIRINEINSASKEGLFRINGAFSVLDVTFNVQNAGTSTYTGSYTLRIYDYDKNLLLAERSFAAGQYVEVKDIDIKGVQNLKFEAVGGILSNGIAYFLDPMVR